MERPDPSSSRTAHAQTQSHSAPPVEEGYTVDPTSDYFTTDTATRNTKRAALVMLLVGGMTFGSFLWLRMRLVSDLPRQAYAEPDAAQTSSDQSSNANTPDIPNIPSATDPASQPEQQPEQPIDATPYSVNDASGGTH